MKNYKLDPARYVSASALAWDVMLLFTKVQLDILPEWKSDIYMLYELGIRGGITLASKRYAKKKKILPYTILMEIICSDGHVTTITYL